MSVIALIKTIVEQEFPNEDPRKVEHFSSDAVAELLKCIQAGTDISQKLKELLLSVN